MTVISVFSNHGDDASVTELTADPDRSSPTLSESTVPTVKTETEKVCDGLFRNDPLQLGKERRKAEMRSLGGMLLILGAGAAHSALALTAVIVDGMGGRRQVEGFRLAMLMGTILQTLSGMSAMVSGFYTLLACPISDVALWCARALIAVVNSGPFTLIVSIVRIAQGARDDPTSNIFIPPGLEPTQKDLRVVAFYGICALISVCATLVGGLTLIACNLCAFLQGPSCLSKNRRFYLLRYMYYCALVVLGGLSQFGLGIYTLRRFGGGPFDDPIHVGVFTVFWPYVTILVGFVQMAAGFMGLGRSIGISEMGDATDARFRYASLASWILTMVLQIIFQPAYASHDMYDAEGATYASVYLGFFIMPVWLEYQLRNAFDEVPPEYFGLSPDTEPEENMVVKLFYRSTRGRNVTCMQDVTRSDGDSELSVQSSKAVL